MRALTALRILSGKRRGSSRPVIVATDEGVKLVKLRGAGQGTAPLVAEIIVGEIAAALGLAVPARSLVRLERGLEVIDGDDELTDTLNASVGINLGFDYLEEARDLTAAEAIDRVPAEDQARILWLDRFTLNPDRTAQNPNVLWSGGQAWLIDHGAALFFHYDWDGVTEDSPRRRVPRASSHLFAGSVSVDRLASADAALGGRINREVIEAAVSAVPDTFLESLVTAPGQVARRRAAYAAFLWKRIRAPRAQWLAS